MRVLLVSEGLHEGSGALEAFVRRVVDGVAEFEFRRFKDSRFRLHHGKDSMLFKRAIAWMREACADGFDAIVLVIDEDGDRQRTRELKKAQNETEHSGGIPRAMGVAIQSFDAWMLADESALAAVLQCHVSRQPAPENERDPKRRCRELLDSARIHIAPRMMYAEVARLADLQLLSKRCPSGFREFFARLQNL
jgi:hypothetical protein